MRERKGAAERTCADALGSFKDADIEYPAWTLNQLSHEDYGELISQVVDLRSELEGIEDELNQAWGQRFELHEDGRVTRRET